MTPRTYFVSWAVFGAVVLVLEFFVIKAAVIAAIREVRR